MFFELKQPNSFINDYNPELTNLYQVIKTKPRELIKDIKKHVNNKSYYYAMRLLDRDPINYKKISNVKKASRFIYLNKSGFNGLYRVNKKGQNNVPFGYYPNPKYIDEDNIMSCSTQLQTTTITTGDFESIKKHLKSGDFVYFDPPYVPLNLTSNFTSYTDKGFDEGMQLRLKDLCDYVHSIGSYFILSNSYTKFVLDLYKSYIINKIEANRSLNCKGDSRGKVNEVIVTNYVV